MPYAWRLQQCPPLRFWRGIEPGRCQSGCVLGVCDECKLNKSSLEEWHARPFVSRPSNAHQCPRRLIAQCIQPREHDLDHWVRREQPLSIRQPSERQIIIPKGHQRNRDVVVIVGDSCRKLESAPCPRERLVQPAHRRLEQREILHAAEVTRLELQRAQQREPRLCAHALEVVSGGEREVAVGERGVEPNRILCQQDPFINVLGAVVARKKQRAVSESGLRRGECWIHCERLLEKFHAGEVLFPISHERLVHSQVKLICLRISRWWLLNARALIRRESGGQHSGYANRDVALHRENVRELTLVLLGPARLLGASVHQFDDDAHPIAIEPDAACNYARGAKLIRHGRGVNFTILFGGRPAQQPECGDSGELSPDPLRDALGEIAVGRIGRQAAERHHGDEGQSRHSFKGRSSPPPPTGEAGQSDAHDERQCQRRRGVAERPARSSRRDQRRLKLPRARMAAGGIRLDGAVDRGRDGTGKLRLLGSQGHARVARVRVA